MANWPTIILALLVSTFAVSCESGSISGSLSDLRSASDSDDWGQLASDSAHFAADVYRSLRHMAPLAKSLFGMRSFFGRGTVKERKAMMDDVSEAYNKFRSMAEPFSSRLKDLMMRGFTLGYRGFLGGVIRGADDAQVFEEPLDVLHADEEIPKVAPQPESRIRHPHQKFPYKGNNMGAKRSHGVRSKKQSAMREEKSRHQA